MGVPWEIIIKMYTNKFGDRKFDKLEEYAQAFLHFVEGSDSIFPMPRQHECFQDQVRAYWQEILLKPLKDQTTVRRKTTKLADSILTKLLDDENKKWKQDLLIHELGAEFGETIIKECGTVLQKLKKEMFGSLDLSHDIQRGLDTTVRHLYTRALGPVFSGVVVAGMGEVDPFPLLYEYQVGDIIAGKLRYRKINESRVGHDDDAIVAPFAQTEMIDMFYRGINPELNETISKSVAQCFSHDTTRKGDKPMPAQIEKVVKEFWKSLDEGITKIYQKQLMQAVAGLPRHDLATMAESLVSLTVFKRRMSAAEIETVAGPIDVAVLSKGDGFIWVRREDPLGRAGNATTMLLS
jgi:hypothetical protein